ncbi:Mitochondrial import inner membrane translocase subunit TIM14 [Echinococcus granulosus]|uniref:Mitochondrial import inner membrane translocase subunit TIM14 n=1 Tax=Echinococcus granulosus TaxID=6210 RepID=W6UJV0_ECHGR|nr:Mitochondrial import inner membrane translocase subunit TIM14 [Echinococcus granulosus]EUB58392.1 Mitochondrial import inner membrane translocase subunit TIM14 [Echinococcus granulosus]
MSPVLEFKSWTTPVLVGLGLIAVGLVGRQLTRQVKGKQVQDLIRLAGFTTSKYYKGGFERKMSRREAALILGVPQSASKSKIRESYKRIMLLNHPDRGGSPYLAAKINEAKDYLENEK